MQYCFSTPFIFDSDSKSHTLSSFMLPKHLPTLRSNWCLVHKSMGQRKAWANGSAGKGSCVPPSMMTEIHPWNSHVRGGCYQHVILWIPHTFPAMQMAIHKQKKKMKKQKHLKCHLDNFIFAKVSMIPLQITGPATHILEYSFRNSVG